MRGFTPSRQHSVTIPFPHRRWNFVKRLFSDRVPMTARTPRLFALASVFCAASVLAQPGQAVVRTEALSAEDLVKAHHMAEEEWRKHVEARRKAA